MKSRVLTVFLGIGIIFTLTIFLGSFSQNFRFPGNNLGYEPVQPIAFSHRLHAGELQVPCLTCHSGAEQSRHAGIPAGNVCMNCHRFVTAPFVEVKAENDLAAKENRAPRLVVSAELRKLYDAFGLDKNVKPDSTKKQTPLVWKQIHRLPDFVFFNHSAHVNSGVECQNCHGAVETMERVRQVSDLSMGWCVNCHRNATANGINGKTVHASTDCSVCHY